MEKPYRVVITYHEDQGQTTMWLESSDPDKVAERVAEAVKIALGWNSKTDALTITPIRAHNVWDLDKN